jgi:hypothetical protein
LARSVLLKDIAWTGSRLVKTGLNRLSAFLNQPRLDIKPIHQACVTDVLKRLNGRRLSLYHGKVILIVDSTDYAKKRSRGKKNPMPRTGKVRLKNIATQETLLAPGYQELWIGVLLKDRTCLPITRRLFTENAPFFCSQNSLEEAEIQRAVLLIQKALKRGVILIGDRGFRRKDLLHWLSQDLKIDFLVRLEGNLTVESGQHKGLLQDLIAWQPERAQTYWRKNSKKAERCSIRTLGAMLRSSSKAEFDINALCVTSVNERQSPIYLATSLSIKTIDALISLVWLYSSRWSVETFFFSFKETFKVGRFRTFSSWEAIDRLLDMAHMAYLALYLLYVFCRRPSTAGRKRLLRSMEEFLRLRSLRPPALTFGKFLEAIALDFAESRHAWGCP